MERNPILIAETSRLRLRTWALRDAPAAFEFWGDPSVMAMIPEPAFESLERTERALRAAIDAQLRSGYCLWAVEEKATGHIVGCCGFHPPSGPDGAYELVYHLRRDRWGRGLATEAAGAALDYLFQRRPDATVVAAVSRSNPASERVLRKLGFSHEADVGDEKTFHLRRR
jgi:[ribosomal protein S5]-alanine N-acetyltransferase